MLGLILTWTQVLSHVMRKLVYAICEQQRRSLISAFVVCCLDSTVSLLAIAEISRPYLVSSAEQAGLTLTWSQTPKTGFLMTWLLKCTMLMQAHQN